MDITVKYNRKNFFNLEDYTEDIKKNADFNDLKKAFSALKKDRNFAIQIDNYCLIWDTIADFEHGSLTCYEYEAANSRKEYLWSFESCKKHFYSMFKD
jgi:hypothetical protein